MNLPHIRWFCDVHSLVQSPSPLNLISAFGGSDSGLLSMRSHFGTSRGPQTLVGFGTLGSAVGVAGLSPPPKSNLRKAQEEDRTKLSDMHKANINMFYRN